MLKVELNDNFYELRRLGLSDIFTLNEVVTSVLAGAQIRGVDIAEMMAGGESAGEAFIAFLVMGMPFAEEDITAWLKSLVPDYPVEDDIYLPDLMALLDSLIEHPDIGSFLERGKKLFPKIMEKVLKRSVTQES